jgi:very-short-patch-repair endonuclease
MPYVRTSYIGWSQDWFDNGDPIVGESFIKFFVNRYFNYPEDWGEDDVPLIMIWVRCITCGNLQECFVHDTREDGENFIYNNDNTYTYLIDPECGRCNHKVDLERQVKGRIELAEEEYQYLTEWTKENKLHFESPLEDYFWKVWRVIIPDVTLIPQYKINNYRVDFAHLSTKTAIELDGKEFHTKPDQQVRDKLRQEEIEQQGWRFIRFSGGDIVYHIDRCIIELIRFLSQIDLNLINDIKYNWSSSPSGRLQTKLQQPYCP